MTDVGLTQAGAMRLRDAVECDECMLDAEPGELCRAHKLLHSIEKSARRFGKCEQLFEPGDRLIVYHQKYRWWLSLGLEADESGLAYGYHVPGQPVSQVSRDEALRWLRDALR